MPKSAAQISAKYQRGVAGAGQSYTEGVQNPKRDQLQAFIAAEQRMNAGIQQSIQEHRAVKNAQAKGGTQKWQQNALAKGATNYANSAQYAAQAFGAVADKIASAGAAGAAAAAAMPNATYADREQRMLANARAIRKAWGKGG